MQCFLALLMPLAVLVKYVPSWFPGAGFKLFGRDCRRRCEDVAGLPFELVKKQMVCAL